MAIDEVVGSAGRFTVVPGIDVAIGPADAYFQYADQALVGFAHRGGHVGNAHRVRLPRCNNRGTHIRSLYTGDDPWFRSTTSRSRWRPGCRSGPMSPARS